MFIGHNKELKKNGHENLNTKKPSLIEVKYILRHDLQTDGNNYHRKDAH